MLFVKLVNRRVPVHSAARGRPSATRIAIGDAAAAQALAEASRWATVTETAEGVEIRVAPDAEPRLGRFLGTGLRPIPPFVRARSSAEPCLVLEGAFDGPTGDLAPADRFRRIPEPAAAALRSCAVAAVPAELVLAALRLGTPLVLGAETIRALGLAEGVHAVACAPDDAGPAMRRLRADAASMAALSANASAYARALDLDYLAGWAAYRLAAECTGDPALLLARELHELGSAAPGLGGSAVSAAMHNLIGATSR